MQPTSTATCTCKARQCTQPSAHPLDSAAHHMQRSLLMLLHPPSMHAHTLGQHSPMKPVLSSVAIGFPGMGVGQYFAVSTVMARKSTPGGGYRCPKAASQSFPSSTASSSSLAVPERWSSRYLRLRSLLPLACQYLRVGNSVQLV